jgi:hypothetical protein
MKLTIANAARNGFVMNTANMFHATTGNMFAKIQHAQKKIRKCSRMAGGISSTCFFLSL